MQAVSKYTLEHEGRARGRTCCRYNLERNAWGNNMGDMRYKTLDIAPIHPKVITIGASLCLRLLK